MGSTLKVHVAEKRTLIEKIKVDLKMRRRTDKIPVLERLAALCGGADIAAKAFALGGEYASTDNAYRKRPTVRK